MRSLIVLLVALSFTSPVLAQTVPSEIASETPAAPLIIAHRGASGERPEHIRAAYLLAIEQGADVIEPDLVMTRDGHLVVRHENEISGTTDVADHAAFANRRATRVIDGQSVTGWFTEDFTLAELQTLRARERLPELRPGNTVFDGREPILTFQQVLDLAREEGARRGRVIAVAPEIKHPAHFAGLGLDMEAALVRVLETNGLTGAHAPILIQCFEVGPLERLAARIDTPLVQLMAATGGPADRSDMTYAAMATPEGLAAIAIYADWIGAETTLIEPRDADGGALSPTILVRDAHAAGLKVAVWTLRAENVFLPSGDRGETGAPGEHGRMRDLAARLTALGVDALFSDHPGLLAR